MGQAFWTGVRLPSSPPNAMQSNFLITAYLIHKRLITEETVTSLFYIILLFHTASP